MLTHPRTRCVTCIEPPWHHLTIVLGCSGSVEDISPVQPVAVTLDTRRLAQAQAAQAGGSRQRPGQSKRVLELR